MRLAYVAHVHSQVTRPNPYQEQAHGVSMKTLIHLTPYSHVKRIYSTAD